MVTMISYHILRPIVMVPIVFVLFLAVPRVVPWDPCTWPDPKLNFEQMDDLNDLVHFAKLERKKTVSSTKTKTFSDNRIYYFEESDAGIDVCADRKTCFSISVPQYSYRPVSAKWINEKLLYFSLSFNPHAGAYWLIDVENETIAFSEHWLDDLPEWLKCNQRNSDTNE